MGLTDINAVTTKTYAGNYNSGWLAITDNDDVIEPQLYSKLFRQYGPNAMLVEILKTLGSTIDVPDADIKTVEKTWPQRFVKVKTAVAIGAAGAAITVVHDATSANDVPWVLGDVILVPAANQAATISTTRGYRVTALATTNFADDTATCYPLSNASTSVPASDIDTAIAAGSYLAIAYNIFARGSTQPGGVRDSFTTRTHTSFLSKATLGLEGNIDARPYYPVTELANGKFTSQKLLEMEFRMQESQALAMLTGEPNDNTSLVEASGFGGNNAIASGMGIYQWADLLGLKHTYAVTPEFADFYTIGQLLASQDITGSTVDWLTGYKFQQDLELAGLDWVKEFSSGTDLYNKMEKRLGIVLKAVTLGGLTHVFYNLPEMSKAGGLGMMKAGVYVYEFPEMGIGIPRENVSYESFGSAGEMKSIPNATMFYVKAGLTDNRKVLKTLSGVDSSVPGEAAASAYHGKWIYMLSQFGLVLGEANKLVLFRKAK